MKERQRNRRTVERPQSEALDLNLRSIDVFIQIAESGDGMSTTARRMGLTQSAVSQMIANLESSLGVQLFDRQVRPLALTPSGLILLEKARKVILSAREAINSARQPTAAAFPKLNLCLVESIGGTIGPDLVAAIRKYAAFWSVQAGMPSQHKHAFLSREADIIITPDELEDEADLERHGILRERFFIAVPKTFEGDVRSLRSLAESLNLVRFRSQNWLGRRIEQHLRRLRIEAKGDTEFDNADSVLATVASEPGWALVTPTCALRGHAYWSQLRFIRMPEPAMYRQLYVIARKGELGNVPAAIAKCAIDSLKKVFEASFRGQYGWALADCTFPVALDEENVGDGRFDELVIADAQPLISSTRRSLSPDSSLSDKLAHNS